MFHIQIATVSPSINDKNKQTFISGRAVQAGGAGEECGEPGDPNPQPGGGLPQEGEGARGDDNTDL